MVAFESLNIQSPKRSPQTQRGWDGFFPYYAGYPESFARALLKSALLPKGAVVLDPWNGSGTTTFSASQLGLVSRGFDLNPVMIVIARARLLSPSEADSLEALARDTIKGVRADPRILRPDDPLLWWFELSTAALIRALERRIRGQLVGEYTLTANGVKLDHISGLAATFYVALFSVCRQMAGHFRSSNPTWFRKPKIDESLITGDREAILSSFAANVKNMAAALAQRATEQHTDHAVAELQLANTTLTALTEASVDMVLTSPPYCTRIDYSAATRIELAVMHPLVEVKMEDLGRQMIGSTRVPDHDIAVDAAWGPICGRFLGDLKAHPSKASAGYYYKTHLDYFEKMALSLTHLAKGLKPAGAAILVVQDSYYKDIHNDLPGIVTEMGAAAGLQLRRRHDFEFKRSMAGINPHTRTYKRAAGAIEAVLCFEKSREAIQQ
ncbi:site-specific DNA-methyltransferase [Mesorhizobium sp. B2-4-12]|nr:site-specific DNA-methyltransferase [Mesorhizobium sp. B2-4-12]TPL11715.1 site-specific DNA-methyltransferase [Mesorhizobium sp. B2-4-14]